MILFHRLDHSSTHICVNLYQQVWSDVELDPIEQMDSLKSSYSLEALSENDCQSLNTEAAEKVSL